MQTLNIDIETFSSVDLKKSGLYKYVQSPDFEILLFAYSLNKEPVKIVDLKQGEKIPANIIQVLQDPAVIKKAYNAPFEWYCLSKFFLTPLTQWRCTLLHGAYCGYPMGLAQISAALGLGEDKKKMWQGSALIRTFCIPCKPTKKNGSRIRTLPHHEPEKWQLFKDYCRRDVVAEMTVADKLSAFEVPEYEQKLWIIDQVINTKGVKIDIEFVQSAIVINEIVTEELMREAVEISGLENPKSPAQLKKWLEDETEILLPDMQKATVAAFLPGITDDKAKRMLQIRQELSKTSVKKFHAMQEALGQDGRARGFLQFYGANRTGRWAGRIVQVQNLPRNNMECLDLARDLVKNKKNDTLKLLFGNVPDVLSQLIRTAFIAEEGKVLSVADYSAIEARINAWLAGETWRLEVFAGHGKIYEASASAMFGVPLEKISKGNPEYELRQKGKVAELALGYQGGPVALVSMGALKMGLTEEELPDIVYRWRQANKNIVGLWYSLERAAIETVSTGRSTGTHGILFAIEYNPINNLKFLTITLPSARKLFYVNPYIGKNRFNKDSVKYFGVDQEKKKWTDLEIYGGKFTENIIQAIARDCLAIAIERLYCEGFLPVFHVHDEVVIETEPGQSDKICEIMSRPIPWAPGLLLTADSYETAFYKKD